MNPETPHETPPEGPQDWRSHAEGSGSPHAGRPLPAGLLAQIARAREAIPVEPDLRPYRAGHMYTGSKDRAHLAYLRERLAARAAGASEDERRGTLAFLALQAREGSTAAINTYDDQIVTWGTGWSGHGYLPRVMERAAEHDAVRDALHRAGVRCAKGSYDVVDLHTGRVVSGRIEGLDVVRRSPALLHLLIFLARSPATRDAVTEAQLRTFLAGSGAISGAAAIASQALFNFVAHLRHWAPAYAIGCMEWAAPQVTGEPSLERDVRLAVLVGRYFYGKARRAAWLPDWEQFRIYFARHLREDGLDASKEPFILAAAAPSDDPFEAVPLPPARPKKPPVGAPALPPKTPPLREASGAPPLHGQPALAAILSGRTGALRKGAYGAPVAAVQKALLSLGATVPGGADGVFGPGLEGAIKTFQRAHALDVDGAVGPATLRALDAALQARSVGASS